MSAPPYPPEKATSYLARAPVLIFLVIFLVRLASIGLTATIGYHPFTGGQVDVHVHQAEIIAKGLLAGGFPDLYWASTFDRWGLLLAVFWLLPGPSALYAQLAMAALGAAGIYNVYIIARYYYSHRAGLVAVVPMAVFPSFVFMHGVVQREALILFALTTAFRLLFVHGNFPFPAVRYALVGLCLFVPAYLRTFNAPVLAVVAVVGVLTYVWRLGRSTPRSRLGGTVVSVAVGVPVVAAVARYAVATPTAVVEFLAELRMRRARGRTVYLADVAPSNIVELVGFSWIAALYFLFAPFPWMVETVADFVTMLESLVTLGFAVAAVHGFRVLDSRSRVGAVVLLSWLLVYAVLFGLGTANFGTGLRHRQAALWVIYLAGAVGAASAIELGR